MPDPTLQDLLDFATEAAREAGALTLRHFRSGVGVEWKADASPVTVADREAEARLIELIQERFPEDTILGEEFGERPGRSDRRWIIDPIDGTRSFVRGVPLYGVLVCLEVEEVPTVGVAYLPAVDEMVCAGRGLGCFWNGERVHVSGTKELKDALLVYTDVGSFSRHGRGEAFQKLCKEAGLVRGWGDCYGHLLVATGRAEVMLDPIIAVWDCAALAPILEEAGGTMTASLARFNQARDPGAILVATSLPGPKSATPCRTCAALRRTSACTP